MALALPAMRSPPEFIVTCCRKVPEPASVPPLTVSRPPPSDEPVGSLFTRVPASRLRPLKLLLILVNTNVPAPVFARALTFALDAPTSPASVKVPEATARAG